MKEQQGYMVEMDGRQWDLVVLALGYVLDRAYPVNASHNPQPIDVFGRRMLRRRINECIAEIQSNVPDAGSGSMDP